MCTPCSAYKTPPLCVLGRIYDSNPLPLSFFLPTLLLLCLYKESCHFIVVTTRWNMWPSRTRGSDGGGGGSDTVSREDQVCLIDVARTTLWFSIQVFPWHIILQEPARPPLISVNIRDGKSVRQVFTSQKTVTFIL